MIAKVKMFSVKSDVKELIIQNSKSNYNYSDEDLIVPILEFNEMLENVQELEKYKTDDDTIDYLWFY